MSEWWRSKRDGEPQEDPVEALVRMCRRREPVGRAVEQLGQFAAEHPDFLTADRLQRVAECLAQETPDRITTAWARAFDAFAGYGDNGRALRSYRNLFREAGPTALAAMRWLVDQTTPAARWTNWREDHLGPKTIGLEAVAQHGDESDLPRLTTLVRDRREWAGLRCAAWLAQRDVGGPDELLPEDLPAVVRIAPPEQVAAGGAVLIEPLLALLDHRDYTLRGRAANVLGRLGEIAVPGLTRLVAQSDSYQALHNAQHALRMISEDAFAHARAARQQAEVGLSRAEPPVGNAERGLSRLDSDSPPSP